MAKINRYRLEYGYGSLKQEMTRTLEPVSDSDYIKVSELKELLKGEKNKLEKHLGWQEENLGDGWDTAHTTGELYSVNNLLAAIDTEGK